jgi:uncharacterized cupin superfamily protein/GNAT superfamily N-acetyltransferase
MKWNHDFDNFVGKYSDYQDLSDLGNAPNYHIKVIDADIGRRHEFKRLAIHHITLPPRYRTSLPHAESLEEEFVFVLKGNPHAWMNGYVHPLMAGHAVGFPAGTGVSHTFINNTESEVELLVLGERTKEENKYIYPMNLELESTTKTWWHDAPVHRLGPHNGLPGQVRDNDLSRTAPECVLFCPGREKGSGYHYPGDNEKFGEGFRISDEVGLKALGIWYEILAPGHRSAFPHAHTHEEEFVYVLQGYPTVWMNGYLQALEPEWFAAFPPGTGIAHTIINDTNEPIIFLGVGESKEFSDEKIAYPLNPIRRLECERKGWYWNDAPKHQFGPHNGRPQKGFPEHLRLVPCVEADADKVFDLFRSSPNYFEHVEGCLPTLAMAKNAIVDRPAKHAEGYIKDFLMIEFCGEIIGLCDLHINHPDPDTCYLGLLLIRQELSGQGLGAKCHSLIEDYVKQGHGCSKMRLGVSNDNEVTGFWKKLGYAVK